jgi:hypothetical protein
VTRIARNLYPKDPGLGGSMQESEETRSCCNLFYVNSEKNDEPQTRNAEVRDSNNNAICFGFSDHKSARMNSQRGGQGESLVGE